MSGDESFWVERAQSAEAKFQTLQANVDQIRESAKAVLDAFGARKRQDGSYSVNFERLVKNLGLEQCMELRKVIDEQYQISGDAGDKPRVKLSA